MQSVLLFGSETWVLSEGALKRLEGFQLRCAWRMNFRHKPKRLANNQWSYPETAKALEECGLHSVEHYIGVRRRTIAAWVVDRPLFGMCERGERRRGSSSHLYWWEQPLDLDGAEETDFSATDGPSDEDGTAGIPAVSEDGEAPD